MDVYGCLRWIRFLSGRGIRPGHIAFVLGVDEALVKRGLTIKKGVKPKRALPPGRLINPATYGRRPILGQTATKVRRFHELGYKPAAIAAALVLDDVVAVEDYLARTTPLRRCRVKPDKMVRPREPAADQTARRNLIQAESRRLELGGAGWLNADRSGTAAAELADYARFIAAVREGRMSAAELVDQAGVFYAPRRRAVEAPAVEPAIWTGATNVMPGNPKLTPEMIAEMRVLRAHGWSTGDLAERYQVTRATICYALLRRTFREQRPADPPAPLTGGIPLLLIGS